MNTIHRFSKTVFAFTKKRFWVLPKPVSGFTNTISGVLRSFEFRPGRPPVRNRAPDARAPTPPRCRGTPTADVSGPQQPEEVGRDFANSARVSLGTGEAGEIEGEVELWRKVALSYWQNSTDKKDGRDSANKLKRVKSLSWLLASEAMLRHVLGIDGWLAFQVKKQPGDPSPPNPERWPGVSIVIDQGSDGWCAGNFMCIKLLLNATIFKDGAHRVWTMCVWP